MNRKGGTINIVRECVKASPSHKHGLCPPFGFQQALGDAPHEGLLKIERRGSGLQGLGLQGLGLQGSGFRVQGLGFRV